MLLLLVVGKSTLLGRLLNGGAIAIAIVIINITILLTLILFLLGPLQYELHITGIFAPFHENFQGILVRGQQPFVVAPSLDEGESAGFPGGMGQGEYHVLTSGDFRHSTNNALYSFDPYFQFHLSPRPRTQSGTGRGGVGFVILWVGFGCLRPSVMIACCSCASSSTLPFSNPVFHFTNTLTHSLTHFPLLLSWFPYTTHCHLNGVGGIRDSPALISPVSFDGFPVTAAATDATATGSSCLCHNISNDACWMVSWWDLRAVRQPFKSSH